MIIIKSKNNVPIRLTLERWEHIIKRHPEMKTLKEKTIEAISDPDMIQKGDFNSLVAIRSFKDLPFSVNYLVVIYKETNSKDGFVITSYITNYPSTRRKTLWKR
ncbi:MAG: hypothetical protein ACOC5R_01320 [Elusimicrobiota bacterium]